MSDYPNHSFEIIGPPPKTAAGGSGARPAIGTIIKMDGQELRGVRKFSFSADAGDVLRVHLELYPTSITVKADGVVVNDLAHESGAREHGGGEVNSPAAAD